MNLDLCEKPKCEATEMWCQEEQTQLRRFFQYTRRSDMDRIRADDRSWICVRRNQICEIAAEDLKICKVAGVKMATTRVAFLCVLLNDDLNDDYSSISMARDWSRVRAHLYGLNGWWLTRWEEVYVSYNYEVLIPLPVSYLSRCVECRGVLK